MKTHKVLVRNRSLSCDSKTIPQGSHGQDEIVLDLDDDWDGLTVYMVIQRGDDKQILNYTEESQAGPVTLPDDILDELGPISVALVGLGTDGSKITTFYAPQLFRVVTAGATSEV